MSVVASTLYSVGQCTAPRAGRKMAPGYHSYEIRGKPKYHEWADERLKDLDVIMKTINKDPKIMQAATNPPQIEGGTIAITNTNTKVTRYAEMEDDPNGTIYHELARPIVPTTPHGLHPTREDVRRNISSRNVGERTVRPRTSIWQRARGRDVPRAASTSDHRTQKCSVPTGHGLVHT